MDVFSLAWFWELALSEKYLILDEGYKADCYSGLLGPDVEMY